MQETNKGKRFEGLPQALAVVNSVFTSNGRDYMRTEDARQGRESFLANLA
jgi:hypothetical protein